MGHYDIAQVCSNGHVTNDSTRKYPDSSMEYCDKCGEKTITTCQECSASIRGEYHVENVVSLVGGYLPPAYCHECGEPFPWTERKISAAIELFGEACDFDEEDTKKLEDSINDVIRDTPRTQLGATRFKKFMSKAGKETAGAVREILVDIMSETAKKMIWPGS